MAQLLATPILSAISFKIKYQKDGYEEEDGRFFWLVLTEFISYALTLSKG